MQDATADDDSFASPSTFQEIAQSTSIANESKPMAEYLTSLLRSPGAEWRRIEKALHLFDHLLINGSPAIISELENRSAEVRYLCDFVYTNDGPDRGEGGNFHPVRSKARYVYDLLNKREGRGYGSQGFSPGYTPPSLYPQREEAYQPAPPSPYKPTTQSPYKTGGQSQQYFAPQYQQFSPPKRADPVFKPAKGSSPQTVTVETESKDVGLFDRLSKRTDNPAKGVDLLVLEPTKPNQTLSNPLDLLSFDGFSQAKPSELIQFDPIPTSAPPQPAVIPTAKPPPQAAPIKITHNMIASDNKEGGFVPPGMKQQEKKQSLDMNSLMSGLDSLKQEVQEGAKQRKGRDVDLRI